jgi:hypothetical protein
MEPSSLTSLKSLKITIFRNPRKTIQEIGINKREGEITVYTYLRRAVNT